MSTNRSVQAAQRRRAGPPEPQQYSRGPNTSINSAQLFANQARPGNGPNIPSGRLAGQHATHTQNQMMQQQYQNQHPNQYQGQSQQIPESHEKDGVQGISKMTIAQAVTLITLRLGVVESKLIEIDHATSSTNMNISTDSNLVQIDKNVLNTIMNRLEALEKRNTTGSGSSISPDITLLKQQMDTIKPVIVQTKNATVSLLKDNKDLKILSENLKQEVYILKDTICQLETLTGVHTDQIKDLVISFSSNEGDIAMDEDVNMGMDIVTDENGIMTSYNPNEFDMNLNMDDLKNVSFIDSEYVDSNDINLHVPPEYDARDLTGINFEEELSEA
uniref:Uncharacterized protein n=1 Tax=viral metagenome TaxID=1070528 RepID=A0A6C0IR48_9ZZZZ